MRGRVVVVEVASLVAGDSPRRGDNPRRPHIPESQGNPPILVQSGSMRIIDGTRRVRAAVRSGRSTVAAQFVDCSDEDAFVLAVRENTLRGGALDQEEREIAADRVVRSHPLWSDRSIASVTGLSAVTVGAIRRRVAETLDQPAVRYGRDGRARPVDSASGRRRAGAVIAARPTATLREIARDAGISIGTARDVRLRLARGEEAVTPRQREAELAAAAGRVTDICALRDRLQQDPALRYSLQGRNLLRWLDLRAIRAEECEQALEAVPSHWASTLAQYARQCAEQWSNFAEKVEGQRREPA